MKTKILILASAFLAFGCASPKYFGDGKYESASYDRPEHMDDRFNEFDSKNLITSLVDQLNHCDNVRRSHVIMVARMDNQTSEAVDLEAFQRELVDQLSQSGYQVIDKTSRPDLDQEYKYQQAGYTDPVKAAALGKQDGVEFVLRGALESKVQTNRDEKTVRYRLSMQAVNLESSLISCTPTTEIKKRFERVRAAL